MASTATTATHVEGGDRRNNALPEPTHHLCHTCCAQKYQPRNRSLVWCKVCKASGASLESSCFFAARSFSTGSRQRPANQGGARRCCSTTRAPTWRPFGCGVRVAPDKISDLHDAMYPTLLGRFWSCLVCTGRLLNERDASEILEIDELWKPDKVKEAKAGQGKPSRPETMHQTPESCGVPNVRQATGQLPWSTLLWRSSLRSSGSSTSQVGDQSSYGDSHPKHEKVKGFQPPRSLGGPRRPPARPCEGFRRHLGPRLQHPCAGH